MHFCIFVYSFPLDVVTGSEPHRVLFGGYLMVCIFVFAYLCIFSYSSFLLESESGCLWFCGTWYVILFLCIFECCIFIFCILCVSVLFWLILFQNIVTGRGQSVLWPMAIQWWANSADCSVSSFSAALGDPRYFPQNVFLHFCILYFNFLYFCNLYLTIALEEPGYFLPQWQWGVCFCTFVFLYSLYFYILYFCISVLLYFYIL